MATTDAPAAAQHAAAEEAPPAPAPAADPSLIALPMFCVGAISLALYLFGFLPAAAAAAIAPAVIAVNGLGLVTAGIWAASLGASMVSAVFMIFSGFWISLGLFLLGGVNGWFAAEPLGDAVATRPLETYLIAWLAVFILLTLVTLRLPSAFTALFVLVDVAVALVLAATATGSTLMLDLAGVAVLGFTAVGAYLFAGAASAGTGGSPLPVGNPVIR